MSQNGLFDFTGFTGFDFDDFGYDSSSAVDNLFNIGNNTSLDLQNHQDADPSTYTGSWYLQSEEIGGTGQPYTGVEVLGALDGFSNLHDPVAAPTTLFPINQMSLDQGYNSPPGLDAINPSLLQLATIPLPAVPTPTLSPVPALSRGFGSPSTSHVAYATGTSGPSVIQVNPSDEGHLERIKIPDPDPFGLFALSLATSSKIPAVATSEAPLPEPAASSSGPQRTRQRGNGKRKHDPLRSRKGKGRDIGEAEAEDGWDVTLAHFEAEVYDIVFNGRVKPSGGSLPETALAAGIAKLTKEELQRSPLQGTKAGEGKRPRNVEDYLMGVLGELVPTLTTSQVGSEEISVKVALLARLADLLESNLGAVNQNSALRRPWIPASFQVGKGARYEQTEERALKNLNERAKRDGERLHLERMSRLFRVSSPQQTWTRVDVLCFAVVFLFCGPGAFSPGFVSAR